MARLRDLKALARRLGILLTNKEQKIVFAESCTGGLVSNVLTRVPGTSDWLCGSAVVYRVETKAQWLGIDRGILQKPGPVSRAVASLMAENVLANTPEADLAAAITGHLGPKAPPSQDGLIFVGIARRPPTPGGQAPKTVVQRHFLEMGTKGMSPETLRNRRQLAAAGFVLESVCDLLEKSSRRRKRQ